jgi:hypothetical protein
MRETAVSIVCSSAQESGRARSLRWLTVGEQEDLSRWEIGFL